MTCAYTDLAAVLCLYSNMQQHLFRYVTDLSMAYITSLSDTLQAFNGPSLLDGNFNEDGSLVLALWT